MPNLLTAHTPGIGCTATCLGAPAAALQSSDVQFAHALRLYKMWLLVKLPRDCIEAKRCSQWVVQVVPNSSSMIEHLLKVHWWASRHAYACGFKAREHIH